MLRRVASIALIAVLFSTPVLAARDEVSVHKWREDLVFLKKEIERIHPDPWTHVSEGEFQKKLDTIAAELPNLTDEQLTVRLMALMASFGPRDGHTGLNPFQPALRPAPLPFFFHLFSDGIFLKSAAAEHRDVVGARLISVDGVPADEILRRAFEITSADNEMNKRAWAPLIFSMPSLLRGLGVAKGEKPEYVLRKRDGTEVRIRPEPIAGPPTDLKFVDARESSGAPMPLYLRHASKNPMDPEKPEKNYWFEYLPGPKLLYVNFSAVANDPDEPIEAFFKRVFDFATQKPVEKFVIDIRTNGGGNNYLNRPIFFGMIQHADTIGQRGRFFVITSRSTFSAAQNLANLMDRWTNAIFVGEPTGGSPNHFGDGVRVTLPNSGVQVQVASLWWQDMDPRDDRVWIEPDLAVDLSSGDYIAGRDPVLQAIIDYKHEDIAARVGELALRGDRAGALAALRAWSTDPRRKYVTAEYELRTEAVRVAREAKKPEAALMVFEITAEVYADSWSAHEALGRMYESMERKDAALAAYERAVKLSPDAKRSAEAIARLKR